MRGRLKARSLRVSGYGQGRGTGWCVRWRWNIIYKRGMRRGEKERYIKRGGIPKVYYSSNPH